MATQETKNGLNCIIQAITNIVDPKVANLKYDKTYRAKITEKIDAGVYKVQINGKEYQLSYNGTLSVGDIVKVKAPLNNFSDIYIETVPSSGGGTGGTSDYNDLTNKSQLNTNSSVSQATSSNEIIKGTIKLHKISKTGNYNDLLNKPNVEDGAQVNVIETIQKNGVDLPISNKTVNITVPTKTSDLTNNSGFLSELPIASKTQLGGIKVGNNLTITEDGILNATGGGTGSNEVDISETEPTEDTVELWVDLSENDIAGDAQIIDNLESTSTTDALSANQGRVLNNKIDNLTTVYTETNITAPTCEGFGKIRKIYGYSTQKTRDGKNKFNLSYIRSSSVFEVTETGVNLKNCWTADIYTHDDLLKVMKPSTTYTMRSKAKVISRPSTMISHQYSTMLLYRPGSSSLGSVVTPVLQMADKETIALNTEKEYITTFTTPADLTDVRFLAYSFYGNNDGSTTGSAQGEIDLTEVMLVEGTYTTETFPDYEPYGVSPSPDYPSKIKNVADDINLFDLNTNKTSAHCTYNIVDNSVVVTNVGNWAYVNFILSTEANKTYTLSAKYNNQDNSYVGLIARNANNEIIKRTEYVNNSNGELSLVFTATSDISNINLFSNANANANTKVVTFSEIQLKEGSTVTPYSPYGEGTVKITSTDETNTSNKVITCKPLCCLKDSKGNIVAQDYVDFTRQKIVRQCGYLVLNGTEEWVKSSATDFDRFVLYTSYDILDNCESISNLYKTNRGTAWSSNEYKLDNYQNGHRVIVNAGAYGSLTLEQFKANLATNNLIIVFEKGTQNEEDIDTTNSIVQYADETTISNSDNAEMEVELTKNKSISSINENIGNLQEKDNDLNDRINEVNTNLNDKINGTTLYSSASGTKGTITLSKSSANFKRIGIEYKDTRMGITNYVEVIEPNGKMINLLSFQSLTNKYITASAINISGNAITWEFNNRIRISDGVAVEDQWNLITKVIGYIY